jgi:hypothetical protein
MTLTIIEFAQKGGFAGAKKLSKKQLLGLGSGKHYDAVDALVYLILGLVGDGIEEQKVHYI